MCTHMQNHNKFQLKNLQIMQITNWLSEFRSNSGPTASSGTPTLSHMLKIIKNLYMIHLQFPQPTIGIVSTKQNNNAHES